jgi:hypothetical protein
MNALTNPTDQKNCSHSRLANDDFLFFFPFPFLEFSYCSDQKKFGNILFKK